MRRMKMIDPYVSIGLPVYNGAKYIGETIETILSQSYDNFELIISDNASSDGTSKICGSYAEKDKRIRYYRNKVNLGAAYNYNNVFKLSKGKYFKWAAHDDLLSNNYIEKCIEIMENNPSTTICHPKTTIIDAVGNNIGNYNDLLDFRSKAPHIRLRNYLFRPAAMWNAIFGLIRSSELNKTPLIGSYLASDQVLLGELILLGKVYQIQDRLFLRREHNQRACLAHPTRRGIAIWFDPQNKTKVVLPGKWRIFYEYLKVIKRIDLEPNIKAKCYMIVLKWASEKVLLNNLVRLLRHEKL